MAIYKCNQCPYFEKKGAGWPLGSTYYCNKYKTNVNYDKPACPAMKGK